MARLPRSLTVKNHYVVHKVWRGHNREWNLGSSFEKAKYLELLNEDFESDKFNSGSKLNAICLMSNHTHEISKITNALDYSGHMRRHHSRYGAFFNKIHNRTGKVAQDRPKTCLIANDEYEIKAVLYIHANPLRANIVKDARDYPYSTHKLYAFGKRASWMRNITFPAWYLRLAKTMKERQKKYRQLFLRYLKDFKNTKFSFVHRPFYGPITWEMKQQKEITQWRQSFLPP